MQQAASIAAAHLSLASMPEPHPNKAFETEDFFGTRYTEKTLQYTLDKTLFTAVINGNKGCNH